MGAPARLDRRRFRRDRDRFVEPVRRIAAILEFSGTGDQAGREEQMVELVPNPGIVVEMVGERSHGRLFARSEVAGHPWQGPTPVRFRYGLAPGRIFHLDDDSAAGRFSKGADEFRDRLAQTFVRPLRLARAVGDDGTVPGLERHRPTGSQSARFQLVLRVRGVESPGSRGGASSDDDRPQDRELYPCRHGLDDVGQRFLHDRNDGFAMGDAAGASENPGRARAEINNILRRPR